MFKWPFKKVVEEDDGQLDHPDKFTKYRERYGDPQNPQQQARIGPDGMDMFDAELSERARRVRKQEIHNIGPENKEELIALLAHWRDEEEQDIPFTKDDGKPVPLDSVIITLREIFQGHTHLKDGREIKMTTAGNLWGWVEGWRQYNKGKKSKPEKISKDDNKTKHEKIIDPEKAAKLREQRTIEIRGTNTPATLLNLLKVYEKEKDPFTDKNGNIIDLAEQIEAIEAITGENSDNLKTSYVTRAGNLRGWVEAYLEIKEGMEKVANVLNKKENTLDEIRFGLRALASVDIKIIASDGEERNPEDLLGLIEHCIEHGVDKEGPITGITNEKYKLRDKTKQLIQEKRRNLENNILDTKNATDFNKALKEVGHYTVFGQQAKEIEATANELFNTKPNRRLREKTRNRKLQEERLPILNKFRDAQLRTHMQKVVEEDDKLYDL